MIVAVKVHSVTYRGRGEGLCWINSNLVILKEQATLATIADLVQRRFDRFSAQGGTTLIGYLKSLCIHYDTKVICAETGVLVGPFPQI
jgi:hypothetical protein